MTRGSMARWALAAVSLIVFGLAGCQTTKTTETQTTPATPTGSEFEEGGVAPSSETTSMTDLGAVYFAYDRYDIRADEKPKLRANADAILANSSGGVITVEGHCDERGSEEYNLALGDRRASGVKRYLVDLGVPASRLRTVSFGEAKPAVVGHDESAWRYNRRSEFKSSL
ncbi:MAG: OmpA family protein [Deltaproteobacteria bacterium]|nr:OmpA family protein [Deltaproteobacteria bacterium]